MIVCHGLCEHALVGANNPLFDSASACRVVIIKAEWRRPLLAVDLCAIAGDCSTCNALNLPLIVKNLIVFNAVLANIGLIARPSSMSFARLCRYNAAPQ